MKQVIMHKQSEFMIIDYPKFVINLNYNYWLIFK